MYGVWQNRKLPEWRFLKNILVSRTGMRTENFLIHRIFWLSSFVIPGTANLSGSLLFSNYTNDFYLSVAYNKLSSTY